jgi:hypothetical protein
MLVSKEPGARIQEPEGPGLSKRWNWIGRDHPATTGSLSAGFLQIDPATLKLESSHVWMAHDLLAPGFWLLAPSSVDPDRGSCNLC